MRVSTLFRADDRGIIFATGKHKNFYKQLIANPHVELLFSCTGEETQISISGAVKLFENLEIKKSVVDKFTFLKPWVKQEGYDQ